MLIMKKLAAISLVLTLSACANTFDGISEGARKDTHPLRKSIARGLFPEANYDYEAITTRQYSYCYKTWASATCYPQPVAGQEFRQIAPQ